MSAAGRPAATVIMKKVGQPVLSAIAPAGVTSTSRAAAITLDSSANCVALNWREQSDMR